MSEMAPGAEGSEPALSELLPGAPLREAVLSACGQVFVWEDVVEWMKDDGKWALARRRASEAMTLVAAGAAATLADNLRAKAQRFRRARRLVAGEDLIRWLADWGISEEEWVGWLDGTLRREAEPPPTRLTRSADEQATWVEVVCSGDLEDAAAGLARALGAWAERSEGASPPERERFEALRHAAEELGRAPVPRAEVERVITANAAAWVQVAIEWADLGSPDAAREAVAAMRDDGLSFAAVAELARAGRGDAVARAEDLDGRTRAIAVSAPLDSPVRIDTPVQPGVVAVVRARRHPSADHVEDGALATAACIQARVDAAVDRWVTWRV
ncbi:MAG TPA: hypothetical protein VMD28_08230 [Acidimicrobiales bacterium]|nr:hypothetical protein [Acidimicrobiales bacterium]